jgi:hypothetical protein
MPFLFAVYLRYLTQLHLFTPEIILVLWWSIFLHVGNLSLFLIDLWVASLGLTQDYWGLLRRAIALTFAPLRVNARKIEFLFVLFIKRVNDFFRATVDAFMSHYGGFLSSSRNFDLLIDNILIWVKPITWGLEPWFFFHFDSDYSLFSLFDWFHFVN